jgi:hypothetical protein
LAEVLTYIEKSISENLLSRGSIGKFIFMDNRGKWFFLQRSKLKVGINYLKHGPWNYFDEIFHSLDSIYESKDILYPGSNKKYKQVTNKFAKDIYNMAGETDFSLSDFSENKYIWNLHAIPFELKDDSIALEEVRRKFKEENCTTFSKAEDCVVKKGFYLSVTKSGLTKESIQTTQLERNESKKNGLLKQM